MPKAHTAVGGRCDLTLPAISNLGYYT